MMVLGSCDMVGAESECAEASAALPRKDLLRRLASASSAGVVSFKQGINYYIYTCNVRTFALHAYTMCMHVPW